MKKGFILRLSELLKKDPLEEDLLEVGSDRLKPQGGPWTLAELLHKDWAHLRLKAAPNQQKLHFETTHPSLEVGTLRSRYAEK